MATADVDICNRALYRVGSKVRLSSLDTSTSEEGKACSFLYAQVRDEVLASFPWAFATKRVTLAPLSGVTRSGWAYAFDLPADCVAPLYVFTGVRRGAPISGTGPSGYSPVGVSGLNTYTAGGAAQPIPFAVESNDAGDGRLFLCDLPAPELAYVARVTAVVGFPPLFVDAVAWKLAAELALGLPVKPQLEQQCLARYQAALARAGAAEFRGQQEDRPAAAVHIAVRE